MFPQKKLKMTFDETTTSTFIILIIIFTIILAAITISILIINQLHMKPRVNAEPRRLTENTVMLESGHMKDPELYHSQPNICHKNYNRRSAESFSYYPGRHFNQHISQNHLNLIKEIQLSNQRSNSTFVYYV